MNKADVIAFFDRCAPEWDADMIRNEPVIQTILDNADVCAGIDVLDVACGTGVLVPDYTSIQVEAAGYKTSITGMQTIVAGTYRRSERGCERKDRKRA